MRRGLTLGRLSAVALAAAVAVAAVLALVPASETYIFLPDEAHAVEPLVAVEGERPSRDGGGIYFVDVIVRRATLIERFFPGIREGSELVPEESLNPTGLSDDERRASSLRQMTRSQSVAAAVALREFGYKVDAEPAGALVVEVIRDTPAAGRLEPADVIVGVDGRRVRTPDDLRRLLDRRGPGARVSLRVRRGKQIEPISLRTAAAPNDADRAVIGVFVEQHAEIDLPIDVRIDAGQVGGPSAGLAFALDVLEELGRDVDRGYKVAATGAIELDGDVAAIGGVQQKTIGAKRSDVDVFLVPAGDNAREARAHAGGLRIIPVRSFQQALRALATLPRRPPAD